jgi:signal transduction histidine kinase
VTNIVRNTVRVLRGVILFRLLLIALGIALYLTHRSLVPAPVQPERPLHILLLAPSVLTTVYLLVPGLERPLGRLYLPIALVATILDFSLQYGTAYLRPGGVGHVTVLLPTGQAVRFFWASTEVILLVLLPCMLAGAAYGLRSALAASSLATVLHLALGAAIWRAGTPLEGFLMLLPVRIGVLYAFSAIVGSMADTWGREHDALQRANRNLRGYAATAEHLATSRERVRLARAMHDTLAHSLAALTVQLEALDALQETKPKEARAQLPKIREHARLGLKEAREAIFDLRSAPVEEFGLPGAVEHLVDRFRGQSGIQTTLELHGERFPLLPVQANALHRILEEALDNVERHAEASQVTVSLRYDSGVTLCVGDDGLGFEPGAVDEGRYGLVGVRERAALVGATVSVESAPGQGTTLTVSVTEPWRE